MTIRVGTWRRLIVPLVAVAVATVGTAGVCHGARDDDGAA